MGTRVPAARFLRSTVISGSVYQQTTAGAAAVDTTIASYALAGLITTIQLVPTTTQTASSTIPTAPATAASKGWRDVTAEDAANQITWDPATWTVRLRMLASAAQEVLTTVIVYRVAAAGGATTEMGRGSTTTALTTTVATVSISVPASAGLVFALGDKIQVEAYVTTTTLGVATAPVSATTITCRVGESDASSGAKITPGTYSTQVIRAATTGATLAGVAVRGVAARRSGIAALAPAGVVQKRVAPTARTAVLSPAGTVQKRVSPTAKVAVLSPAGVVQKRVSPGAKVAALALVASATRAIVAARSGVAVLSPSTVFARSVNSARSFTSAITLTGSAVRFLAARRSGVAVLSLATSVQRRTAPAAKVAALSLSAAATRTLVASRAGTAALSLGVAFARSVNSARAFSTALAPLASGLVQMPLHVLNRIVGGGGTTVIRKVMLAIFDD